MKGELVATLDPPDVKNTSETPSPRARKSKRRPAQGSSAAGSLRFFLSKAESNGVPSLDREFASEPEAIVESLKTGKNYFVISEWKGQRPELRSQGPPYSCGSAALRSTAIHSPPF